MKKSLQIKNYPVKEIIKLKTACVKRGCGYVNIVVPAVEEYLKKPVEKTEKPTK